MRSSTIFNLLALAVVSSVSANAHYENNDYNYNVTPNNNNNNNNNYQVQKPATVTVYVYPPAKTVTVNQCSTTPAAPSYNVPATTPSAPPSTPPTDNKPPSGNQYEMLCRVNAVRAKHGKKPLKQDSCLMAAAQAHSADQAARKKMTHEGTGNNKDLGNRLKNNGYSWRGCAENIAWNQPTIEKAVEAWVNSSGHLANMLGDYECFGYGEVQKYWTQDFASGKACSDSVAPKCDGY